MHRRCNPGEGVQVSRPSRVWREAPHPDRLPVRTGRGEISTACPTLYRPDSADCQRRCAKDRTKDCAKSPGC
ncbi:hypothetical protein DXU04_08105 [Bradyrhizobium diazoefficiens]